MPKDDTHSRDCKSNPFVDEVDSIRRKAQDRRRVEQTPATVFSDPQSDPPKSTSTRQPDIQDIQDIQESEEFKDCQDPQDPKESKSDPFSARQYRDLPAGEFLRLAWEASQANSWEETGCSPTWELCRHLHAHPRFQSLRGASLARVLRLADIDEESIDVILSEIERVKFAHGGGPVDWAVLMASQHPLSDPEGLELERYNKFLSVAGWLQVSQGKRPIILPVDLLSSALEVSPRMISHWRQRAMRQGILREVRRHIAHVRATEFVFDIDRFSILRERGNL
jgi:hypothetical protein